MSSPSDKYVLTALEYQVLFEKGTEPAFSHPLNDTKEDGVYQCKNCENPLFLSEHKFDSGSGWPSFFEAHVSGVNTQEDHSHGMNRIEVTCNHCHCHLGHVFPDGPAPTGLRYCINGSALNFISDY